MKNINKKEMINIAVFLIGVFLVAITYNIFCVPNNYVTGGVSGLAIVFKKVFNINVSYSLLIGNLILVLIGILVLGLKKTAPSVVGSFFYTLMVYLTENINEVLNINLSNTFLNIITIGVLFGIGCTMVYLSGYTTGGTDILALIFYNNYGITMGNSLIIINFIILTFGTMVFGIEMLIIALIIRYIESKVIDSFLLGISDSKVLFINTDKVEEVREYIINEVKSGTSEIKITSGYNKTNGKVIMCVVPTEKYIKLKEKILKIDKDAFITIIDAYEVYGGTNRYKLPLHDLRV